MGRHSFWHSGPGQLRTHDRYVDAWLGGSSWERGLTSTRLQRAQNGRMENACPGASYRLVGDCATSGTAFARIMGKLEYPEFPNHEWGDPVHWFQ